MKFFGNAHLQQNELQAAVIPLDTAFPISPVAGQIVFKDRTLYICIEVNDGVPIWCPLTKQITAYTHVQTSASSTWTVNHGLNTSNVSITIYDADNRVVIPNDISINSSSSATVYLAQAATGKVVVLTGYFDGQELPTYAYEFTQTNPSTTWVIPHALGRYPIVRVFIGNQEVQPASITFDTIDQLTITFSSAQVGQVKLM